MSTRSEQRRRGRDNSSQEQARRTRRRRQGENRGKSNLPTASFAFSSKPLTLSSTISSIGQPSVAKTGTPEKPVRASPPPLQPFRPRPCPPCSNLLLDLLRSTHTPAWSASIIDKPNPSHLDQL
eukprot:626748-Hanusia_phi.AAC.8